MGKFKKKGPMRFIKNIKTGRVVHLSPYNAERDDMIECNKDGIPLYAVGAMAPARSGGGIKMPPKPKPVKEPEPDENLGTEEQAEDQEEPEANLVAPGPDEANLTGGDIDFFKRLTIEEARTMTRSDLVNRTQSIFGAEAAYLKANWSYDKIFEEIGRLIAMTELG